MSSDRLGTGGTVAPPLTEGVSRTVAEDYYAKSPVDDRWTYRGTQIIQHADPINEDDLRFEMKGILR